MGVVWSAEDTVLKRTVAIKILPDAFARDRERLGRFEREAQLLASLNHPNIAAIHGLEQADSIRFLVLEHVPGETLAERLASGALPPEETLKLGGQLAHAMEAAHARGILHCDLKPANIKVTPEGKVKVLDFGLAKAFDDPSAPKNVSQASTELFAGTREHVIMGTAPYMSPEQASGGPLDKRTDVWSFGCVLYEMLTGRGVFVRDTVSSTLAAIQGQEPDWNQLPAATPARVRELLARCLRKDPERRLCDLGDARIEIEDALAGREWLTATESRAALPARRSAASRWLAAAVLILLGVAVGIGLGQRRTSSVAVDPVRVRTLTFSGHDREPSASPDGRLIAFTSDRDGRSRIWIKQLSGGGEEPLTDGPDSLPRFSPDGSTLLFLRDKGSVRSVYRQALVGGEARKLVEDALEAAWSPDGRQIAFIRLKSVEGRRLGSIGVADSQEGGERVLMQSESYLYLYGLRWSPDGDTVIASSVTDNILEYHLILVDPRNGQVERHQPGPVSGPISAAVWTANGELIFARAGSLLGDQGDALSRVVRYDVETGDETTLFWAQHLFPSAAARIHSTRIDVVRSETLVFHQVAVRQILREAAVRTGTPPSPGEVLTRGHGRDRQPVYSPDGTRILFSSNRTGNLDLWMLDVETGALRQLTDDAVQDWDPGFTPDGRQIVWSSNRTGPMEIWISDVDGSGARQLTRDGVDAQNPTATADGEWIVYRGTHLDKFGVWKIRPDGSDATHVVEGAYFGPDTSPDGRYAAYRSSEPDKLRNLIHVVDLQKGEVVRFLIEVPYSLGAGGITFGRMRWLPDGSGIAYVGVDEQNRTGIYAQDFIPGEDTAHTRRPLAGFSPDFITESFGISPDGSRIVLAGLEQSYRLMLAEGTGVEPPR